MMILSVKVNIRVAGKMYIHLKKQQNQKRHFTFQSILCSSSNADFTLCFVSVKTHTKHKDKDKNKNNPTKNRSKSLLQAKGLICLFHYNWKHLVCLSHTQKR